MEMQYFTNDDRSAWDATDFLIAQGPPWCPKGTKIPLGESVWNMLNSFWGAS